MVRTAMVLVFLLMAAPSWASSALRVVTTLPDLADWVRQIGGERVEVVSLLHGTEDPHTYEPRVSDIRALARARVLVTVGLGLEEWVAGMVENSRNSELLVVEAGAGLALKESGEEEHGEEEHGDDEHGHHAAGNPHVWLDPDNAVRMCERIARELEIADPAAGAFYQGQLKAYQGRLAEAAKEVRARVGGLEDRRFISYHPAWPYFARSLGFEVAGVVTPIPGQEPSARAVAALVKQIRSQGLRVLVTEPQLPSEIPDLLAEETGIAVVTLSPTLGAGPAPDYLSLLRANADTLVRALGAPPR